jgi:hypothetical protein
MHVNFSVDRAPPMLLVQEVKKIIADASSGGGTLQVGPHAKRLRSALEATGLSQRLIADELIRAAARAGIPVEMDSSG